MRYHRRIRRLFLFCAVALPVAFYSASAAATSLRFYGNGVNDIDRVKIRVSPQTPADIGTGSFTIEFWMKARPEDYIPQRNEDGTLTNNSCQRNNGNSWINGNIMFDRALFANASFGTFGISMFQSGIAFGVTRQTPASDGGLCGSIPVNDGLWHHIAITRDGSAGTISLFVDGILDQREPAPSGDVSYDDLRTLSSSPPVPPGVDIPNVEPFLVIGAEKYSLGDRYPSFSGWIDEVRLSNIVRYTANFSRPTQPFSADANTVALYHFDEAGVETDTTIVDVLGTSPGERRFGTGGVRPAGPVWSADSPFAATPNPGVLRFSLASVTVDESAGSAVLNVTRSGGSSGRVTVDFTTENGSALAGSDYGATAGMLSWENGETGSKSITIPIIDDSVAEEPETFTVRLSNVTNGATIQAPNPATVTIMSDDSAGVIGFGQEDFSVSESGGMATITVNRSGGSAGAVSVTYAVAGGTAQGGVDYTVAAEGVLGWNDGETGSRTITISIVDDAATESNETISFVLRDPTGGAVLDRSVTVLTIVDNEGPATVSFAQSSYTVNEAAGTVTFTVLRRGTQDTAISVNYATTDASARAGADYVFAAGTLTFAPGVSSQTITITVTNDTDVEGDETLNVVLDNPSGAVLGTPMTAGVTIVDNDSASVGGGGGGSSSGSGGCVARLGVRGPVDLTLYFLIAISFLYRSRGVGRRCRRRRARNDGGSCRF